MSDTHSFEADELVSAYVDGVLSPDEAARVEADPALLARVAELEAAGRAVRTSAPEPPAAVREAAIARAMDEAANVLTSPHAHVSDLARVRPSRWDQLRGRRALSIAAAVLVLLVGGSLLSTRLTDRRNDDLTAAKQSTTLPSSTKDEQGGSESATAAAGVAPPSAAGFYDLGRIDRVDELVRRVRPLVDGGRAADDGRALAATEGETTDQPSCEGSLRRADPSLGRVVWRGTAIYQTQSIQVYVFEAEQTATRTLVAAILEQDCRALARRDL